MIESIVDKDLHNKLLNAVGREKMKTTFKNLEPGSKRLIYCNYTISYQGTDNKL